MDLAVVVDFHMLLNESLYSDIFFVIYETCLVKFLLYVKINWSIFWNNVQIDVFSASPSKNRVAMLKHIHDM